MPAQVSKLINALKRNYPELKDEPMLDELESAAYADPEAAPADDGMVSDDSDAQEAEPADADGMDELMPALDDEGEDLPPPPKRKRKGAPQPWDDEAGDEPSDVNGKY